MNESFRTTLPGDRDPRKTLEDLLRSRWTRDITVSEATTRDRYQREFTVSATRVDLIFDNKTGARTFVLMTGPPAGTISAHLTPKGWKLEGPSKRKFFEEFSRVNRTAVDRSEKVLLEVAHDRVVEVPLVQTALSPIRSIVVWLDLNNRVDRTTLAGLHKPESQIEKYMTLLTSLKYAKKEGDDWVQGAAFPSGTARGEPKELYDGILANVVDLSFAYLREVIRLTQMVGYLWWSNSYFLTALEQESRVALLERDLAERKAWYYKTQRHSAIEETAQIQRVLDTRLLQRENGSIVGDEQKTEEYLVAARSEGLAIA